MNTPDRVEAMKHKHYRSFDTQLSSDAEPFRNYFNELLRKFEPESYKIWIGEGEDYGRDIVAKIRKISSDIDNIVWFQYGSRPIEQPLTLEIVNKIQENLEQGIKYDFGFA
jgi:hypothetical protein